MKPFPGFLIFFVFSLLAACSTTPTGTPPVDTFNHSEVGFSIAKPSGWSYISRQTLEVNRDANRSNNAKLEEVSRKNGDSPFLVVFARYPEPNPKNNPTVSVTVVDMGMAGLPPKGMLTLSTVELKKAYPDLVIVEKIHEYEVDGIMGAFTKVSFTVAGADEQKMPSMHRMWLVPRGTIMFSIAMTGPQEGPDVSEEAFQEILSSIRIKQ